VTSSQLDLSQSQKVKSPIVKLAAVSQQLLINYDILIDRFWKIYSP